MSQCTSVGGSSQRWRAKKRPPVFKGLGARNRRPRRVTEKRALNACDPASVPVAARPALPGKMRGARSSGGEAAGDAKKPPASTGGAKPAVGHTGNSSRTYWMWRWFRMSGAALFPAILLRVIIGGESWRRKWLAVRVAPRALRREVQALRLSQSVSPSAGDVLGSEL
jgi:hypothetical protein